MREESNQEALWVLRAQSGDREALELLLRHIQPSLRRYLRSLVGPDDGDDVVQQVMLLIYRNLSLLEDPEVFRPWAFSWSTFAIVLVMIRMTKRILRAIELGARLPKT